MQSRKSRKQARNRKTQITKAHVTHKGYMEDNTVTAANDVPRQTQIRNLKQCIVCNTTDNLKQCDTCHVVSYCSTKHKRSIENTIKRNVCNKLF